MTPRRRLVLVLAVVVGTTGASHRTPNFVVNAPTPEIAERVGQWAEYYRKQKAFEWVGHEMPNWPTPCPLHVKVTMSAPGGATHFTFGSQGVTSQEMEIFGPLDRLINSVLPHEITHTVFAYFFRCPVPRWADEGGSVLSEDDIELENHNKLVRKIMNNEREFPLRRLLTLRDYPPQHEQVMCLYAQGFSLSHYLVHRRDKQTFLKFIAHGMRQGWDNALQAYYQLNSVEALEQTWRQHMRDTKGMTIVQMKARQQGQPTSQPTSQPTAQTVVRTTVPPAQPLQPTPIYRGVAATSEEKGLRFGDPQPVGTSGQRPGYLPEVPGRAPAPPWAPVQLGPVELEPPPGAVIIPGPTPAGFPR